jgi:CubicO group peptidase (beta-lactamase class C family)
MNTCRRKFIKDTAIFAIGAGFLPSLSRSENIFTADTPFLLPRMSPESQGVSSAAIRSFIKATAASGLDWHSFMLLRHGNVIAEGWWKPFDPQYKHTLYSLSKSFTSTGIGLLVKEGKIAVDDPVISFFKEELPDPVSDNLAKMKIKHLLTMNTGHGQDTMDKLRNSSGTWTKAFLAAPVEHEPGSHFLYNTGATYMLGAIIHKVTGQTLEQYLGPRLFQPLGIKEYDWETSPQGLNTAGYGLRVKTEDIARLGQLYLQKGKWEGKQLLTEGWIDEATRYQTSSNAGNGDWSQGYGYQFWRCKPGFYRGDGAFGQFCIVMPEQDAVLAITSESSNMQKSMTTVWETLLPAIQNGPLKENPTESGELKKELKNLSLPVPKAAVKPPIAFQNYNKKFNLDDNEFKVSSIQFKLSDKNCSCVIKTAQEERTLRFGWENWLLNPENKKYIFNIAGPGRQLVPSKAAGTAAWIDNNVLQLNLRFVESIHGDRITCKFDGDTVTLSFKSSLAEITNNNPEKRKDIQGKS